MPGRRLQEINPYTPLKRNSDLDAEDDRPTRATNSNSLSSQSGGTDRRHPFLTDDTASRSRDNGRDPRQLFLKDEASGPSARSSGSDLRHLFLKDEKREETSSSGASAAVDLSELLSGLSLDEETLKEGPIVLYYGWFFPEDVCFALKEISETYLQQCFFGVPQFERFLTSLCEKAGVKDEMSYYRYPSKDRKTRELPDYHVTARFLGREPHPCSEYWKKVAHLVGTTSPIQIIGLFFTEKTYGFRVKLTKAQQNVFDERDINPRFKSTACDNTANAIQDSAKDSSSLSDSSSEATWTSKKNNSKSAKPVPSDYHPKILVMPQETDFAPCNSRAHITIGTAPNVQAVQTGHDLKDLVNLETRATSSVFHTDYVLENGDTLRQFGRYADAFMLYFSKVFMVEGKFWFKE